MCLTLEEKKKNEEARRKRKLFYVHAEYLIDERRVRSSLSTFTMISKNFNLFFFLIILYIFCYPQFKILFLNNRTYTKKRVDLKIPRKNFSFTNYK